MGTWLVVASGREGTEKDWGTVERGMEGLWHRVRRMAAAAAAGETEKGNILEEMAEQNGLRGNGSPKLMSFHRGSKKLRRPSTEVSVSSHKETRKETRKETHKEHRNEILCENRNGIPWSFSLVPRVFLRLPGFAACRLLKRPPIIDIAANELDSS